MVTRYAAVGFLYHAATRQVLLHHRDANAPIYADCWAGFGGTDEPADADDPARTWRRELREELGIEVAPEQIRPLRQYVNPDVGRLRYIFYAEWPALTASFALTEGDGCAWFPLDAAIALPDLLPLAREDLVVLRETVAKHDPTTVQEDIATARHRSSAPDPGQEPSDPRQELHLVADELRGSATLWQTFAANVYERERADQAMHLAARITALAADLPLADVSAMFDDEGWHRVSPALGVDNVVLDEHGQLLLLKRRDNQHWCMPGGIAEIGQTPAEAALKELWEEAGLRGEIVRLLGVFDGRLWGSRTRVHMIHLVYLVQCADLTPAPGVEMLEAGFFSPNALPDPMHSGHGRRAPFCVELARTGQSFADPSTSYGVEMPMHQRPGH
ncbi:MAG: NUDIX domain-containing protein [Chloroflexota bacterium]